MRSLLGDEAVGHVGAVYSASYIKGWSGDTKSRWQSHGWDKNCDPVEPFMEYPFRFSKNPWSFVRELSERYGRLIFTVSWSSDEWPDVGWVAFKAGQVVDGNYRDTLASK